MGAGFSFIHVDNIITYYTENPSLTGYKKAGYVTEPVTDAPTPDPEPTPDPVENEYQVPNGGFEQGFEGWINSDETVYKVYDSATDIWGNLVNNAGKYAYSFDNEAGKATLTSSTFKVGGTSRLQFDRFVCLYILYSAIVGN